MTVLALGANVAGRWGGPRETIAHAVGLLAQSGARAPVQGPLYRSRPVGSIRQADYLNTIVACRWAETPLRILQICKAIEAAAGRRSGPRWGPRCLDIDIIMTRGIQNAFRRPEGPVNRAGYRPHCVVLPHPEFHRRAFVLQPLAEVAPRLVHPVLGLTARQMLERLPARHRHGLRRIVATTIG